MVLNLLNSYYERLNRSRDRLFEGLRSFLGFYSTLLSTSCIILMVISNFHSVPRTHTRRILYTSHPRPHGPWHIHTTYSILLHPSSLIQIHTQSFRLPHNAGTPIQPLRSFQSPPIIPIPKMGTRAIVRAPRVGSRDWADRLFNI